MAVYAIAMFSITDRAVYGRYQAQFMGVMNRYKGTVLAADEHPVVVEGKWDRDKVGCFRSREKRIFASLQTRRNIRKFRRTGELERMDL